MRADRENVEMKLAELRRSFQDYVLGEGTGSADIGNMGRWADKNGTSVFPVLNGDGKSGLEDGMAVAAPGGAASIFSARIVYRDGEALTRFIYQPMHSARFASWVVALLLAFDIFLVLSFLILKRKLDYVLRIGKGLSAMESGNLEHTIPVEGADELARLAESANLLGRSIRDRMRSEQRALQANREIIGELSHDIRTPLTVGMGYLNLLLEKEGLSERERREYLILALRKAEQIGERTRSLLDFSTLASGQMMARKNIVDARTLIRQLEEELSALAPLMVEGELPQGVALSGDVGLLERLFDNLLSNLQKHGDTNRPVVFRVGMSGGDISIEMENAIPVGTLMKKKRPASGSSLGLKICACILELHGGSLETSTSEKAFCVKVLLSACSCSELKEALINPSVKLTGVQGSQ